MTNPNHEKARKIGLQQYNRLKAESEAPYRGLRQFIYIACGGSGFIGAFVFFMQLLAGKGELSTTLGNLSLQIGVIALMIWLFRFEQKQSKRHK